jgi:hypothetical protein
MATTPAFDAKMPEIWNLKHLHLPINLIPATTGEENKEDDGGSIPSDVVDRFQSLFAQVTSDSMVIEHVDKNVVLDEFLLELVGSVVSEHVSVKQAVGLLSSVEFAQSSVASQALTDTLWFWGSQVSDIIIILIQSLNYCSNMYCHRSTNRDVYYIKKSVRFLLCSRTELSYAYSRSYGHHHMEHQLSHYHCLIIIAFYHTFHLMSSPIIFVC